MSTVAYRPQTVRRRRIRLKWPFASSLAVGAALWLLVQMAVPQQAFAATAPVELGTAGSYSVLGATTVTNTGPTSLGGDLGVSPGTAITGFPPGTAGGATHAGDAQAAQAQSDLAIAYDDAAGRAPTEAVAGDLVGRTLTDGVYKSAGPLEISGTLTLDAQGDPDAVFIFQVASTLITASASTVALINGAQACHVYWQVGSSATLGTNSTFLGSILALTSISVTTGATVKGRALARNGAVTLDNDTFTDPSCTSTPPPSTTTTAGSPTAGSPTAGSPTAGSPTAGSPTAGSPTAGSPTSTSTSTSAMSTSTPQTLTFSLLPGSTGDVTPPSSVSGLMAVSFGGLVVVLCSLLVLRVGRRRSRGKHA
jgi:hypothetical protein